MRISKLKKHRTKGIKPHETLLKSRKDARWRRVKQKIKMVPFKRIEQKVIIWIGMFSSRGLKFQLHAGQELSVDVCALGISETCRRPDNDLIKVADEQGSVETLQRMCRGLGDMNIVVNQSIAYMVIWKIVRVAYQTITVRTARILLTVKYIYPSVRPADESPLVDQISKLNRGQVF